MAFDLCLELSAKIQEKTLECDNGVLTFPHILVKGFVDDVDGLKGRLFKNTWFYHDTEEEFLNTCDVLARRYNVPSIYIRTAFWLMEIHYMDGENDGDGGFRYNSFQDASKEYGVGKSSFEMMTRVYGRSTVSNVVNLAHELAKEARPACMGRRWFK